LDSSDAEYYKIFPHGQKGSPEIYSGGKHYLLSAGWAYRGKNAKVISRPITLLLEDDARELNDCIHIKGRGDWKTWNMTGVHKRFAVAKGTVFVPEKYMDEVQSGWNILKANDKVTISFYQGEKLGILLVLPDTQLTNEQMMKILTENNANLEQTNTFFWPKEIAPDNVETITFDINAPANQWVITSINGQVPPNIVTRELKQSGRVE
jgi:hypothetical protein